MDAVTLLTNDHDKVRRLFRDFETAEEAEDSARQEAIAEQILHELEVHTSIEEEILYPAAGELSEETRKLMLEGVEEHHVVDTLMSEISDLGPDDEAFAAKMTVLIENVEHHAEEEESELFPKLREELGDAALKRLGTELAAAKDRHEAGAATDGRSRDELYSLAQERDLPGRSSMTKEELAEALEDQ